jgi:hypothetical protein
LKTFTEKFKPIEIELVNIKGESFILESKFISSEEYKALELINNDENIINTDKVHQMCTILLGKDPQFWSQFSLDLLTQAGVYLRGSQKKK